MLLQVQADTSKIELKAFYFCFYSFTRYFFFLHTIILFCLFFPNAYNKLHGFYYTYVKVAIETILLPHKCFVQNILSNKASCYETYAFAFYVALFVKIDVSVQIIQIKKGVLNVNISYENNKFFLENF